MFRSPDRRWCHESNCSKFTFGDESFLVGKTPVTGSRTWSVEHVKRKASAILDLTNTNYYPEPTDIEYLHIRCIGHTAPPGQEEVDRSIEFLERALDSGKVPLIHCTHGHNRSGFIAVILMCKRYGKELGDAMNTFRSKRHPGIDKKNYIQQLQETL